MAMSAKMHDELNAKLTVDGKPITFEVDGKEVSIFEWISKKDGLYELAVEAFPKLKDINADLKAQKDNWKSEKVELETKMNELTKNQITEEQRNKLKNLGDKGMTPEKEAELNSLKEKVETLTSSVQALTSGLETEREAANAARLQGARDKANTSLFESLGKYGIKGVQASAALAMIKEKGMVDVKINEDGSVSTVLRDFNSNGEPLAVDSFDQLSERFAKSNEFLVQGTTSGGSGDSHNFSDPGVRPSAFDMMKMNTGYDN